MTTIIGISAVYHDAAACLIKDGNIIAAAQEERFTRIKHDQCFPAQSISYCLEAAQCQAKDIDYVVFYDKPLLKFNRLIQTYLAFAPKGFESFATAMPIWLKDKLFQKNRVITAL
jgi:carbamoyltransferase